MKLLPSSKDHDISQVHNINIHGWPSAQWCPHSPSLFSFPEISFTEFLTLSLGVICSRYCLSHKAISPKQTHTNFKSLLPSVSYPSPNMSENVTLLSFVESQNLITTESHKEYKTYLDPAGKRMWWELHKTNQCEPFKSMKRAGSFCSFS